MTEQKTGSRQSQTRKWKIVTVTISTLYNQPWTSCLGYIDNWLHKEVWLIVFLPLSWKYSWLVVIKHQQTPSHYLHLHWSICCEAVIKKTPTSISKTLPEMKLQGEKIELLNSRCQEKQNHYHHSCLRVCSETHKTLACTIVDADDSNWIEMDSSGCCRFFFRYHINCDDG